MIDFSPLKGDEALYECYEDVCFQILSRNRRYDEDDSQEDDNRMCDLTCKCSPGLSNSIAQKSSTSQESSQEQTVELETALGYGSIALAVCLLIVLGLFSPLDGAIEFSKSKQYENNAKPFVFTFINRKQEHV